MVVELSGTTEEAGLKTEDRQEEPWQFKIGRLENGILPTEGSHQCSNWLLAHDVVATDAPGWCQQLDLPAPDFLYAEGQGRGGLTVVTVDHRFPRMKCIAKFWGQFPPDIEPLKEVVRDEDESTRACAETEVRWFRIYTVVLVKGAICGGSWIVLTTGRGGRMGQLVIMCPSPPQYKHIDG